MRKAKNITAKLVEKVSKAKSDIFNAMKPEDKVVIASAQAVPAEPETTPRHGQMTKFQLNITHGIVPAEYLEEIVSHLEDLLTDGLVVTSMSFGIHHMSAMIKDCGPDRLKEVVANMEKRYSDIKVQLIEPSKKH